jgi:hypothetical protein
MKSSGNQCGISKWKLRKTEIQRGTQEIKVDFQIEIKVESSGFNKSKKNTKWNLKWKSTNQSGISKNLQIN